MEFLPSFLPSLPSLPFLSVGPPARPFVSPSIYSSIFLPCIYPPSYLSLSSMGSLRALCVPDTCSSIELSCIPNLQWVFHLVGIHASVGLVARSGQQELLKLLVHAREPNRIGARSSMDQ